MNTMSASARRVTHMRHDLMQRTADRRRAGLAFRMTTRLFPPGARKQEVVARRLGKTQPTVSRWSDGKHDSEISNFRRLVRGMAEEGMYPIPIILDLIADAWTVAPIQYRTLEELRERKKRLHREETIAQHRVDVWQLDDAEDLPAECEDSIDEAILEHATRLVELFAIRQEIRLLTGR